MTASTQPTTSQSSPDVCVPPPAKEACVLAIDNAPVTIEQLELEIAERAFASGWVTPRPPSRRTGFTVAVVGSGPAGLAAAQQLNSAGHRVYRLRIRGQARWPASLRHPRLQAGQVHHRPSARDHECRGHRVSHRRAGRRVSNMGTAAGRGLGAVLVAIGAQSAHDLSIPGRELAGVHLAMPYLEAQNRAVAQGGASASSVSAKDKRVVILGGGDTGADCCGTALRQGRRSCAADRALPGAASAPGVPATRGHNSRASCEHRPVTKKAAGKRVFAVKTLEILGQDVRGPCAPRQ